MRRIHKHVMGLTNSQLEKRITMVLYGLGITWTLIRYDELFSRDRPGQPALAITGASVVAMQLLCLVWLARNKLEAEKFGAILLAGTVLILLSVQALIGVSLGAPGVGPGNVFVTLLLAHAYIARSVRLAHMLDRIERARLRWGAGQGAS